MYKANFNMIIINIIHTMAIITIHTITKWVIKYYTN